MAIRIDDEFKSLIPPLTESERSGLEDRLRADGCLSPLVVWNGILLDGHNRLEICERLNIQYGTKSIDGIETRDDAMAWIIQNQFSHRNLTKFQRAELVLRLEPLIAAKAKERMRERKGNQPGATSVQNSAPLSTPAKTRDELAKIAGISHDTIDKAKTISKRAPEEVKDKLRRGETSINVAYQQVRRTKQMAANAEKSKRAPRPRGGQAAKAAELMKTLEDWANKPEQQISYLEIRRVVKELAPLVYAVCRKET